MDKVLVLAPHTDDGELGCGATVANLLTKGAIVKYCAFSIAEDSVPSGLASDILDTECRRATARLGLSSEDVEILRFPVRNFPAFRQDILDKLISLRSSFSPSLVFCPSSNDVHQDHKVIYEETLRAFKRSSILGYEFMWNNFTINSTFFSVVTKEDLDTKVAALSMYESQSHRIYTQSDIIRSQANLRGLQVMEEFAEAFEVIRWVTR